FLGFAQERAGVVEKHHPAVALVLVGQPAESGAQVDERVATGRKQPAEGYALDPVFVAPALALPEAAAIVGALIVDDGRLSGRVRLAGCVLSGLRRVVGGWRVAVGEPVDELVVVGR